MYDMMYEFLLFFGRKSRNIFQIYYASYYNFILWQKKATLLPSRRMCALSFGKSKKTDHTTTYNDA
jgi:hypothetical protein